ncbi:hypothetical protein [Bifidobacterium oedipodis]|uniref:MFS transporter n=1 Tax=Bifidobacterium oedipodis TaxID=2675322 RepID=A0A7Y0EPD5_9BIFI|nr:hypothetical protein [Bifidobacterium sp. DSM 109957]NMM93954.1 MFS transporter [Bifidobacterium sp. DSM 109957]
MSDSLTAAASKQERLAAYNANIAAADADPTLSPETGKTMDKVTLIRFGVGFLVFGLLWMSGLAIVSAVLLTKHLQNITGSNDVEGLVGVINSCTAIASLVSNLMFVIYCIQRRFQSVENMGFVSDNRCNSNVSGLIGLVIS